MLHLCSNKILSVYFLSPICSDSFALPLQICSGFLYFLQSLVTAESFAGDGIGKELSRWLRRARELLPAESSLNSRGQPVVREVGYR